MEKRDFPAPNTQGHYLLTLTGICGEFPAGLLSRLPGGVQYWEKVITELKKEKLLHTYYRDHLRGYRLGQRAKKVLLSEQSECFSFFLTGKTDTNLLKSEVTRRLRLHRIAAATVTMQNAGVNIFRDEKPDVFAADGFKMGEAGENVFLASPAFYSSREVKAIGLDAVKIRGSRMVGVLLARSGVFTTYIGGTTPPEWDYRAEQRAKSLLSIILCRDRMAGQFDMSDIHGLILCDGMEVLAQTLAGADTAKRCGFLLDGNYEHFYYLTNDHCGDVLLSLLCDADRQVAFRKVLLSELRSPSRSLPMEYDAVDKAGRPVLFAYLPDIPRLGRFLAGLSLHGRQGCIACFDFQAQALESCCGKNVTLLPISFEQFERGFCP